VKRVIRGRFESTVMLESAKLEQQRIVCHVEYQRKELEIIQQSNQAYAGLSMKVTGHTSYTRKLQSYPNEGNAAMAEANTLASVSNINSIVVVYETATAESIMRAAEANTATSETSTRTLEYVALRGNSRYQQALKLAGLAQCTDIGTIYPVDYHKVKDYICTHSSSTLSHSFADMGSGSSMQMIYCI
jgi:hypothetical protein